MKCAKCQSWNPFREEGFTRQPDGFGSCMSEAWKRGYGWPNDEPAPASGILVEDDEGWAFYTGPEFGCVHFEPKP